MKENKNSLINEVADELGLPRKEVKKIIDLFIKKITEALIDNKKVLIKGFATFSTKLAKPRAINDFQNDGKKIMIGERMLPKAKFSESFSKRIKK